MARTKNVVYSHSENGGICPSSTSLWEISINCPNGLIFCIDNRIPSTLSTLQNIGDTKSKA